MRYLTLSRRSPLSYRSQSIDLGSKSMDWFLYDYDLRLERVKRNRNIIKRLPWTSTITSSKGQNDMKRTWKNIMQITNVNKRFTTFVTTIKHKKHIDNRAKISENSHEFLRSFVKSLKVKFLHPMKWSVRMLSFKMRNLRGHKNDIFDHQSRGSLQSSAFRSTCP